MRIDMKAFWAEGFDEEVSMMSAEDFNFVKI